MGYSANASHTARATDNLPPITQRYKNLCVYTTVYTVVIRAIFLPYEAIFLTIGAPLTILVALQSRLEDNLQYLKITCGRTSNHVWENQPSFTVDPSVAVTKRCAGSICTVADCTAPTGQQAIYT